MDPEGENTVMLAGYIDESYTSEAEPVTFGLSCILASYSDWFWIGFAWEKVITQKNAELEADGRRKVMRFHATDINNLRKEFHGWNGDERTDFTRRLLEVIKGHELHSVGFTANLGELAKHWPRVKFEGLKEFGYDVMMRLIMKNLERRIRKFYGAGSRIIFINDRSPYDGILRGAFNHYLNARPAACELFTSMNPQGWENCIPLQLADFIAYESMKEASRFRDEQTNRPRRKSLAAYLSVEGVDAVCWEIPTETILKWKKDVEERDRLRNKAELNELPRFVKKEGRTKPKPS